jgi:hypothetical protein
VNRHEVAILQRALNLDDRVRVRGRRLIHRGHERRGIAGEGRIVVAKSRRDMPAIGVANPARHDHGQEIGGSTFEIARGG